MTEAIFGLLGVVVGSGITWLQNYLTNKRAENKNAKYLAIRTVCILDKFGEDCAGVVKDDGLSYGQRTQEGHLHPQVNSPGAPIFPHDVDWTSINPDLMYKILSLPSEVEAGDMMIKATADISAPPDFEEWFNERRYFYSQFGMVAFELSAAICTQYKIARKVYNDWNPEEDLAREFNLVREQRKRRIAKHEAFVRKVFGNM